jgi:dienelactone hydrolase/pimeloyl-ACP methyl ester carboxylesterase
MLSRRQMLLASGAALVPACTRWATAADAADPTRFFADCKQPDDFRLRGHKTLNDYFPFTPPKTKEEWAKRRERVREQVLVSQGLWPLPEKTPLNAVVHGKIDRDGYTVEKVFFASTPGHYVCGNLYRPKPVGRVTKFPAVLFAHGHWAGGRLHEVGEAEAKAMVARGEESSVEQAKLFMQAIPITLAKLGFVVFQYDMVGYADSTAIKHVARSGVPAEGGFADAEGELRLQSLMGLQTWNSVRSIDFVQSLPDVDGTKIGVTGASGGGTQAFVLAAIDERITAAAPAVMVSTAMQGGCVCENCSLFRVGTGNIELAALIAPRPMALPSANDWTKDILTKGYPQLKQLYRLLGAEGNVTARAWLRLPHNFGRPSREYMYEFFLKHLKGQEESIPEPAFAPLPPKQLSVFDADHPRPKDELGAKDLRQKMAEESNRQMVRNYKTDLKLIGQAMGAAAEGKDPPAELADQQKKKDAAHDAMFRAALRAMLCDELPAEIAIRSGPLESKHAGFTMHRAVLGRKDEADAVPHAGVMGPKFKGDTVVIWAHPKGKASLFDGEKLAAPVQALVDAGCAVVAPDVLGVGELPLPKGFAVDKTYAGFTYGYNRSLLANRVHDVLTTVGFAKFTGAKTVHLIGLGEMGPVAVIAKAAAGDAVKKLAADLNGLDFAKITDPADPMMLPGALKYGGFQAFQQRCPDDDMWTANQNGKQPADPAKAVEWVLK